MRLFLLILLPIGLSAQCPDLNLPLLQHLQRTGMDQKQHEITKLGFDLRKTTTKDGIRANEYNRCWHTTRNNVAIFDQRLIWDVGTNSLVYFTRNKREFQNLRYSIESRQGNAGGNLDFYRGRKFFYRFGKQDLDGEEYFSVRIQWRN